ncbi:DUF5615 family PIN-like protein [Fibrella sp. HMF5335]|uniref:DUF5615 family PIN-like protein n=1 Tax=Fibrella rubiginis TaxID=2817060 RepID=A0A939K721_9BACT|nr:DUF5615 family PIN-like protein [Fibrella rubiginis]MBO0938921.1 DUF5615 family PIN-like protein [Fibrella rubiginis]
MTYIIDAQLPYLLADILRQRHLDAIHTRDLPDQNRTGDNQIRNIALIEDRILITKDADFQNSYLLQKSPPKLLLISTGNIKNRQLLDLIKSNIDAIDALFEKHTFIELDNETFIVHD